MKFVFVGNRKFVLEEMISANLHLVNVLVVKDSHLEKDIVNFPNTKHLIISSKHELVETLNNLDFDILISNGCPFILPLDKLKPAKFINIHPSYLPDLRGVDPVVGAMLFKRNFGATCHYIDEGIDTGDIIDQVEIPFTADLDIALAYQLSFIAEKQTFLNALKKQFKTHSKQKDADNLIYYKRSSEDQTITFNESNEEIINKIRAFSNKSQGVSFRIQDYLLKCFEGAIIRNPYLTALAETHSNLSIIFKYEDTLIIKKDNEIIKLSQIQGDMNLIESTKNITN